MMAQTIRIGINGFGRIGRNVARILIESPDCELAVVNDLYEPGILSHLLRFDSVHGRFSKEIKPTENGFSVDGKTIRVTSERDPAKIPWKDEGVEFVLESTGVFRKRDQIEGHLAAGAKKVILTVPAKDELDATIVLGVNDDTLKPEHKLISNASCTTNCVGVMAKVLHDAFGIERGLMTTVHAYTNDQQLLDLAHTSIRRSRAAAANIIPTTTGAAVAVTKVIPELEGRLDGMALRVPVLCGSLTDLVTELKKDVTVEEVNAVFKKNAEGELKGILEYSELPLVSSDIVHTPHSVIIDGDSTMLIGKRMVKTIGWYDNEWGYSNRCVDLFRKIFTL